MNKHTKSMHERHVNEITDELLEGDNAGEPSLEVQLDRLVDGELDATARRELLLTLERQPELWRRCALAFLEAQAWRPALRAQLASAAGGAACGDSHTPAIVPVSAPAGQYARRWRTRLGLPLAMAASFLAAFALSMVLQSLFSHRVNQHDAPGNKPLVVAAESTPPAASHTVSDWQEATARSLGADTMPEQMTVRISVPDATGETMQTVDVPMVEADSLADSLAKIEQARTEQALPAEVWDALERTGHRVERLQQWMAVDLQDGRAGYVPVEQISVHYVGGSEFQ